MSLKSREWKEFLFTDIFDIKKGFYNKKPKGGNIIKKIPFLGATASNNGVTSFYSINDIKNSSKLGYGNNEILDQKIFKGNCIAVTNNGSVGYAYYQPHDFTCSHDINPLYLKNKNLNGHLAMFLICAIEKQKVCFEYARKWRPSRMIKSKIILPKSINGQPDYDFMEQYIKEKYRGKLINYKNFLDSKLLESPKQNIKPLKEVEWSIFKIGELFTLSQGKSKGLNHLIKSNVGVNYLGATNLNNAVLCQVDKVESLLHKGNAIAFIRNGEGSMGYSVYKSEEFIATSDISVGYNKRLNKYIGTFITTIADQVRGKYNFGYKRNGKRLSNENVLLPSRNKKVPDYEYMESYVKNFEYKRLEKMKSYLDRKIAKHAN
ncbi:restriction endonuclease subunit S [Cysteiniphilum halobium]|uniref:restriction endonuclease subunit S n=1 Tax=Cysteiniphilum halobium TaxID=2219059 RepID=UPI000E657041|nr:restriction endonuclease subunit S [Cysteiniphilum halobium]